MRINHTGEVCAQALYAGQASTAKLDQVRESMEEAAAEEETIWPGAKRGCLNSRAGLPCLTLFGTPCRSEWALQQGWRGTNGAWALWPKPKNRCANIWNPIWKSSLKEITAVKPC